MAAAEAARPWRAAEPAVTRVCCFNDNTELALLAALRVLWPRAPHDPVRRRILELLADGERTSGALCAVIQAEFGISEPGVSAHLHGIQNIAAMEPRPAARRFEVYV